MDNTWVPNDCERGFLDGVQETLETALEVCNDCGSLLTEYDYGYADGMADAQEFAAEASNPEPPIRQYVVTYEGQIVVDAEDEIQARIMVAEDLDQYVAMLSSAKNDPMNGRIIKSVVDITFEG